MPVNTTQVSNVVMTDTFTQFKDKTNEVISIVNGLPATSAVPIDRTGGTIDGKTTGAIPQGDSGSLYITESGALAIGDYLGAGQPANPTGDISILQTDATASINVTSTSGTANLILQGAATSAIRFLKNSTTGMIINFDNTGDKLDIRSLASGTETGLFAFTKNTNGSDNLNGSVTNAPGRFGIGTTDPKAPLHIIQNRDVAWGSGRGSLMIGPEDGVHLIVDSNEIMARSGTDVPAPQSLHIQAEGGNLHVCGDFHNPTSAPSIFYVGNTGTPGGAITQYVATFVNSSHSVGINKNVPGKTLDVDGTFRATGASLIGGTLGVTDKLSLTGDMELGGDFFDEGSSAGAEFDVLSSKGGSGLGVEWVAPGSSSGALAGTGASPKIPKWSAAHSLTNSIITESGSKIGISEASPDELLHITGPDAQILIEEGSQEFVRLGLAGTVGPAVGWDDGDAMQFGTWTNSTQASASLTSLMTIKVGPGGTTAATLGTANVGIGTTAPTAALHVNAVPLGYGTVQTTDIAKFTSMSRANDDSLKITSKRDSSPGTTDWNTASIKLYRQYDSTALGYIRFGATGGSGDTADETLSFGKASSEYMRIDAAGEVGINQTNPQHQLDVGGTFRATLLATLTGGLTAAGAGITATTGGLDVTGLAELKTGLTVTNAGVVKILSTTDATSSAGDNGALQVKGGASIVGKLFAGGAAELGTTSAAGTTTIGDGGGGVSAQNYPRLHVNSTNAVGLDRDDGAFTVGSLTSQNLVMDGNIIQSRDTTNNPGIARNLHLQYRGGGLNVGADIYDGTGGTSGTQHGLSFRSSSGEVGINKNVPIKTLDVGGTFRASGAATLTAGLDVTGGSTDVELLTASDLATLTGGLTAAGAGITATAGGLDVTGLAELKTGLTVSGSVAATISTTGGLTVTNAGVVKILSTSTATSSAGTTGALQVTGGASIKEQLYVGANTTIDSTVKIKSSGAGSHLTAAGTDDRHPNAVLQITGDTLGLTEGSTANLFQSGTRTNNADFLSHRVERMVTTDVFVEAPARPNWMTAMHKIGRQVDSILMGYIGFGSTQGGALGTANTIVLGSGAKQFMIFDNNGKVGLGLDPVRPVRSFDLTGGSSHATVRIAHPTFPSLEFKESLPTSISDNTGRHPNYWRMSISRNRFTIDQGRQPFGGEQDDDSSYTSPTNYERYFGITETGNTALTVGSAIQKAPSKLSVNGAISMSEQSSSQASAATHGGYGQVWVKNDVPTNLMFTNDAGTDHVLSAYPPGHFQGGHMKWPFGRLEGSFNQAAGPVDDIPMVTNRVLIHPFSARDQDNLNNITETTAITCTTFNEDFELTTASTTLEGSISGGFASGATRAASTWYGFYAIYNTVSRAISYGFTDANDIDASLILDDAVTLATAAGDPAKDNWTSYIQLGWVMTVDTAYTHGGTAAGSGEYIHQMRHNAKNPDRFYWTNHDYWSPSAGISPGRPAITITAWGQSGDTVHTGGVSLRTAHAPPLTTAMLDHSTSTSISVPSSLYVFSITTADWFDPDPGPDNGVDYMMRAHRDNVSGANYYNDNYVEVILDGSSRYLWHTNQNSASGISVNIITRGYIYRRGAY